MRKLISVLLILLIECIMMLVLIIINIKIYYDSTRTN